MSIWGTILGRIAAEKREFRRWVAWRVNEEPRVYYGVDHLPGANEPVSGGIVKCMDLSRSFPNHVTDANLLYLVSSALPARRELLVRHAKQAGGRFVLNQNGVAYPAWAGGNTEVINAPNARVHARADHVVYQSEYCRRCAHRFLGQPSGTQSVLHNPVDTTVFRPADDTVDDTLLVAGSHHDAYRVKHVIDALKLIHEAGYPLRLIIAGRMVWSDTACQDVEKWVAESGLKDYVRYVGDYTQAQAPDLVRQASVLVHLQVMDSCPRLVVEAMASGLPVVYSDTGGSPELVGEHAGVAIPGIEDFETIHPPEVDDVAAAIVRMWSSRDAMSRAARQRAETMFSLQPWIEAHRQIFEGGTDV